MNAFLVGCGGFRLAGSGRLYGGARPTVALARTFATLGCLGLAACSSTHVTRVRGAPDLPATDGGTIRRFRIGESPERACEILGKVFAEHERGVAAATVTEEEVVEMLPEVAARLGADVVLDVQSSSWSDGLGRNLSWASGLAARWSDTGCSARESTGFTVAVLPLRADCLPGLSPELSEQVVQARLDKTLQYMLEKKGYYVRIVGGASSEDSDAPGGAAEQRFSGLQATYALTCVWRVDVVDGGPVVQVTVGLQATLYECATGRAVADLTGRATETIAGLVYLFANREFLLRSAMAAAVSRMLKPLEAVRDP